jgi:hypothetical protein
MDILDNRCPHAICVVDAAGDRRIIEPSGPPVRIETVPGDAVGLAGGIAVHASPGWKCISNLPPRREDTTVIVSQLVALAVAALHPERGDVVYPGTDPRDGASRVRGRGVMSVTRLIRAI